LVKEGDIVKIGDTLFIMEVMKTEVNHDSPIDGTVTKVNIVNDQEGIDPGTIAIIID
jgi:biotin carboxyl carrier protein